MFQFLIQRGMWWDATLSSVSIEWRGHSIQQIDWSNAFWCKKNYYTVFFASVWVCGGWCVTLSAAGGRPREGWCGRGCPAAWGCPQCELYSTSFHKAANAIITIFFLCAHMKWWLHTTCFQKYHFIKTWHVQGTTVKQEIRHFSGLPGHLIFFYPFSF